MYLGCETNQALTTSISFRKSLFSLKIAKGDEDSINSSSKGRGASRNKSSTLYLEVFVRTKSCHFHSLLLGEPRTFSKAKPKMTKTIENKINAFEKFMSK
jgi:hypothetical protein